jgi:alpha-D-ribose 1-methylphosphonate 5-triphosphate synthase subunit PhnH
VRGVGLDPVHDTRATFRALCRAMSRPGTVQSVPTPADYAVFATLADHEVTVHTSDEQLRRALDREGRLSEAPPESAQLLHTRSKPEWDVRNADRGSLLEPSDGATVVYRTGEWSGTRLTVRGPGVPDERSLDVGLPAAELDRFVTASSDFPRGVDAVFTTESEIAAIPRSATVEVA